MYSSVNHSNSINSRIQFHRERADNAVHLCEPEYFKEKLTTSTLEEAFVNSGYSRTNGKVLISYTEIHIVNFGSIQNLL